MKTSAAILTTLLVSVILNTVSWTMLAVITYRQQHPNVTLCPSLTCETPTEDSSSGGVTEYVVDGDVDPPCDDDNVCTWNILQGATNATSGCLYRPKPSATSCESVCYRSDEQEALACNGLGTCTGEPAACKGRCDMIGNGNGIDAVVCKSTFHFIEAYQVWGTTIGLEYNMWAAEGEGFCYGDTCIGYSLFTTLVQEGTNNNNNAALFQCSDFLDPEFHGTEMEQNCIEMQQTPLGGFFFSGGSNYSLSSCWYRYACGPINTTIVVEFDDANPVGGKRSLHDDVVPITVSRFLNNGRLPAHHSAAANVTRLVLERMKGRMKRSL